MAELVEVLDDDGAVVGVVPRAVMRSENLLHRSVAVVVRTHDGRLLVHRRSVRKDVWPSRWDLCVGGVVTAGEDVHRAACREVAEEAGIDVGPDVLVPLGSGRYDDASVRTLVDAFTVTHDGPFEPIDGEVDEFRLVTADELDELAASQRFVPDSWSCVLPLIPGFAHLADRGSTDVAP